MSYEDIANKVLESCEIIQDYKHKIDNLTKESNRLKKEVREMMMNNDLWKVKDEMLDIALHKPSERFDVTQFKKKYPELASIYIKTRFIQIEEDDFDQKEIKEKELEAYEKCVKIGTPALYIKEVK